MVKYLTIILILATLALTFAEQNLAGRFEKEAKKQVQGMLKRGAAKIIQGLVSYCGFLEGPKIILDLFEVFTGVEFSNDEQNAKTDDKITASLENIDAKVNMISQDFRNFEKEIMAKMDTDKQYKELKDSLDKFYNEVDNIDIWYRKYLDLTSGSITYSNETHEDFSTVLKGYGKDGLHFQLEKMHSELINKDLLGRKNIPMYYANVHDLSLQLMCQSKQSAQRLIFNLYELTSVNEIRGAIMMAYAYKKLLQENSMAGELTGVIRDQESRMNKTLNTIKSAAAKALREIWICDPQKHKPGTTFDNFGSIFQKFVMFKGDVVEYARYETDVANTRNPNIYGFYLDNEVERVYKNICGSNTCASIKRETPKYCYSYGIDNICEYGPNEKFTCRTKKGNIGIATDCEPVAQELKICLAEENDYRRYKTIDTGSKVYGQNETCTYIEQKAKSKKLKNYDCDYCLCTCVQDSEPQNHVSLRTVTSDVDDNKIITGVQIEHVNGVFQIKIEQGTLLANGLIDRNSTDWKEPHSGRLNWDDTVWITWDHRTFLLDDLEGPKGHVLTGIRFEADGNVDMKLGIQTMPFNLTSGKLQTNESLWSNNPNTTAQRMKLKIAKYGVPTLYKEHKLDSESNQFIQLTTSDMEQDIGQTVVPFFDIQPVNSTYPMPLSGAGFIHKGHRNSAGFLALKVTTFDINLLTPKDSEFEEH